jgi:histidine ammonia-lyase
MFSLPELDLKLEDVQAVAKGARVRLSASGHRLVGRARKTVMRILAEARPVYGVNTGFGALADRAIPLDKVRELQTNLILSHAAGAGSPLSRTEVRAVMFLRANTLSKGFSGVRCKLIEQMNEMLNRDVVPVVYEHGSVGASGDLAPLAHVALAVIGRGEAFLRGRRMNARSALEARGLAPYELQPKEGLSLINGTEVMAATGALTVLRAERLADLADAVGALTCAALGARPRVFAPDLQRLKPYPGQRRSAANLRAWLQGTQAVLDRVQDAYSLRCIPQVHGAAREGIASARRAVETEINSVTDNPVVLRESVVSGGNFHGSTIALFLDVLAIALAQLGAISERRTFRLLDPKLSGLPAFLVADPGVNSGLMIAQMLAATLVTECKLLAAPASIHSLPTSAGQEDFVSMGMNSSLKARTACDHVETILAIELLCAAQAIELSGRPVPARLKRILGQVRRIVPFLAHDRELHQDIQRLKQGLASFPGFNS